MKKKLTATLAALASLAASSAIAQDFRDIMASADYSLTLDNTFASSYVFRGVKFAEDVFHPSLEFTRNDLYLGLWAALPLEKRGWPNYFLDEYNLYGGHGWAINDELSVDIGGTLYYFTQDSNSLEGFIGLNWEFGALTPAFYLFRDFDLDTWTYEASFGYGLPFAGTSLDLSGHFGLVNAESSSDLEDYSYWGVSAVIPYELKEKTILSFGVHYAENDIRMGGIGDNTFYGTVSLTIGLDD